jgi:hypothetical protein
MSFAAGFLTCVLAVLALIGWSFSDERASTFDATDNLAEHTHERWVV